MAVSDVQLEVITAPSLEAAGVRHSFFTRKGGVSEGIYDSLNAGKGSKDHPKAVAQNRARIAASFGLMPDALVSMNQTHSALVAYVDAPTASRPKVDALVTDRAGVALGVLHADCAPVLFVDPVARVVGAAHAGWRGANGGVLEATIERMGAFGAAPSRIKAAIGPTIGPLSYEVGPEFPAPIVAQLDGAERFFSPSPKAGHFLFDLPGYILARLQRAGVEAAQDLALDTYADPSRFFSYRRTTHAKEGDYGRLLSAIVLED